MGVNGPDDRIRTCGILLPKQALYQTEPHPGINYQIGTMKGEDALVARVAVPEKIIGLTRILDFFDRCLQIDSLDLPPAALVNLAQSKRSTKLSHIRIFD